MKKWQELISTGIGAIGFIWLMWGIWFIFAPIRSADLRLFIFGSFVSVGIAHLFVSFRCWLEIRERHE